MEIVTIIVRNLQKQKKHFKVIIWNKGSSHSKSENKRFLPIKTAIENHDAEIIVLTEAEFSPKDGIDILGQLPNYHLHHKVTPDADRARVNMVNMVKPRYFSHKDFYKILYNFWYFSQFQINWSEPYTKSQKS